MTNVAHNISAEHHVLRPVKLHCTGLPRTFRIAPSTPLDEIVLNEGVLRSHATNGFHAAIADSVASDDLAQPCILCARATPVAITNVQAGTIGPLDRVALNNPVIPAGRRDEPSLRHGDHVAGMLKCHAFHTNKCQPLLQRSEDLLARSGLNDVFRRSSLRNTHVNAGSGVIGEESTIWSSTYLLHDRCGSCARGQAIQHLQRVRQRRARQIGGDKLPKLFHGFERFTVHEDQASAAKVWPHVDRLRVQPGTISR